MTRHGFDCCVSNNRVPCERSEQNTVAPNIHQFLAHQITKSLNCAIRCKHKRSTQSALPMTRHVIAERLGAQAPISEACAVWAKRTERFPTNVAPNIVFISVQTTRQLPWWNHANCRGIQCTYIVHTRMNFAVIGKISSHWITIDTS